MKRIVSSLVLGCLLTTSVSAFSVCKPKHHARSVVAPVGAPNYDESVINQALLAAKDHYYFNVRFSIPQAVVGILGASLTYRLSDEFAVGPVFKTLYWTKSLSGGFYGAEAAYALSGHLFMPGWQINPFIHYWHYKDTDDQNPGDSIKKGYMVAGSKLTYQWIMTSGFNIQAGLGALVTQYKMPIGSNAWAQDGLVLFPALTIGWAF